MDFIVSEFINLIKGCSNGLSLEKEIWRRGIELQCRAFARALETYDAKMARQYAGKQEVLRLDRRTMLCMFGTVTFSRRLVQRKGEKPFYPPAAWVGQKAGHGGPSASQGLDIRSGRRPLLPGHAGRRNQQRRRRRERQETAGLPGTELGMPDSPGDA